MATNTPNLKLLKKDPVADGNETFNIQTMLNENWDKIDEAMGQVREDLQDIDIPPASLTKPGIVQLSNSTNGTREDVAATEKAVKMTYDAAVAAQTTANAANLAAAAAQTKADQAFQLGNERKSEVVAALVAKGISASTSESWDSLLSKLTSLIKATGNAAAADVLSGKTFSNASGNNLTGTMPNRGVVNQTITTQGGQYNIPAGYHDGSGKVTATFANLVAGNVKSGVNIGGVVGTLQPGGYGLLRYNSGEIAPTKAYSRERFATLYTFPPGIQRIAFISSIYSADFYSRIHSNQNKLEVGLELYYGNTNRTYFDIETLYLEYSSQQFKSIYFFELDFTHPNGVKLKCVSKASNSSSMRLESSFIPPEIFVKNPSTAYTLGVYYHAQEAYYGRCSAEIYGSLFYI